MRTLLVAALAVVTLGPLAACKDKPAPAPPPARATPAAPAPAPAPAPPQTAPVADVPAPPAAPPDPAAAARSGEIRTRRAAFLERAATTAKTAGPDCAQLGAALAPLADEARALPPRRDLLPADLQRDEAMVRATVRALTQFTSACPDTAAVDGLLGVVAAPMP